MPQAATERLEATRPHPAWRLSRPSGGVGTAAVLIAAWLALIAISGLHRADFLSHQTLLAVSFTMSIVGVLAVAQALVAISGGILDLSQPAALILTAFVIAQLLTAGVALPLVLVAAIATGALWGLVNATIIVFGKINPIIVTLATNFIGAAGMFLIFQNSQTPLRTGFAAFGRGYGLGLPNIFWPMLITVVLAGYFLPRTRVGRHVIAVGGSRFAAQARGISLRKTRFGVFVVSGAIVGLAGILFAASNGPYAPADGASFLLPVIAGVILAGVSLSGGRGNLWLILPSVGFLSTVPTALAFFGLSSNWQAVFQGFILMGAVALDGYQARRLAR